FCPGKKDTAGGFAHWDCDVAIDLDAIQAWGATTVITLLEGAGTQSASGANPWSGGPPAAHELDSCPVGDQSVPHSPGLEGVGRLVGTNSKTRSLTPGIASKLHRLSNARLLCPRYFRGSLAPNI